MKEDDSFIPQI